MDRFEQLTAYFAAVSTFHKHRDKSMSNVVALTIDLPELLDKITQPTLRRKLQSVMTGNAHLFPSSDSKKNDAELGTRS
jgi:hypothetical protein